MTALRIHRLFCLAAAFLLLAGCQRQAPTISETEPVLMICEHGTVKSLIAASLFNDEAKKRGLAFRAASRGVDPDNSVPAKIQAALLNDGFDVSEFEPQKLMAEDIARSLHVVAIGTNLSQYQNATAVEFSQWDDVPPASVDYQASRDSLQEHIRELLDELEGQ